MKHVPNWLHHWFMFLLICLIGLANMRWGEKLPINDGLGWDGQRYGILTAHLEQIVSAHELNAWLAGRILPCTVVHYGLRGFGLPLTAKNIIRGFEVYNFALLLLTCIVWMLIANVLRLSTKGRWLGFMALFVNFPILKQTFYYPMLTDTTAFFLGVLLLYLYLKDSTAGMFLTLFAAAFTWPTFVYPATLLLIFPRRPAPALSAQTNVFPRVSAAAVAGIYSVVLVCFGSRGLAQFAGDELAPTLGRAVIVSGVLCVLYLIFATRTLLGGLTMRFIVATLANWRGMHFVSGFSVVVLSQMVIRALYSTDAPPYNTVQVLVHAYVQLPMSRPLIFLLGHMIYFGPMVILLILHWSATCEKIRANGLGMVFFMWTQLVMALNPESRSLIHVWPFFVVFLTQAIESKAWKPVCYVFLAVTSVLFSKIWLPINVAPLTGSFLDFPFQRYFMNHGPWISNTMYAYQGIAVLLTAILCWWSTKRESTA